MRITSVVPPAMGRASSPCLTKRSLASASDRGCKRSNDRMVMVRLERNGLSLLNALFPRSQVCTAVDRLLTDGAIFERNPTGQKEGNHHVSETEAYRRHDWQMGVDGEVLRDRYPND